MKDLAIENSDTEKSKEKNNVQFIQSHYLGEHFLC